MTIQETILDQARRIATERGVTISEVIEEALRKQLLDRPEPAARPFQLHTVRGRLVNPNLDLDRTSALIEADDEAAYRN